MNHIIYLQLRLQKVKQINYFLNLYAEKLSEPVDQRNEVYEAFMLATRLHISRLMEDLKQFEIRNKIAAQYPQTAADLVKDLPYSILKPIAIESVIKAILLVILIIAICFALALSLNPDIVLN